MNLLYLHSWYLQDEATGQQHARDSLRIIDEHPESFPVNRDIVEIAAVKKQSIWMLAVLLRGQSLQENTDMLASIQVYLSKCGIPFADNKSFLPARGNTIREALDQEYAVISTFQLNDTSASVPNTPTQADAITTDAEELSVDADNVVVSSEPAPTMQQEEPDAPLVEDTADDLAIQDSDIAPAADTSLAIDEAEKLAAEAQIQKQEKLALRKQKRKKRILKSALSVLGLALTIVICYFFIQSRRNAAIVTYTNETFETLVAELQEDATDQWAKQIYSALHLQSVGIEDGEEGYKVVTMHITMPVIEQDKIPFPTYDQSNPKQYLTSAFETCSNYIQNGATQSTTVVLDVLPADSGYEHTYHTATLSALEKDVQTCANSIWRSIAASGSVLDATTDILFPDPVTIDYSTDPPEDIDSTLYTTLYQAYLTELSNVLADSDLEIDGLNTSDADAIYQVLYQKLAARLYAPYEPVLSWNASLQTLVFQITMPSFDTIWEEAVAEVFKEVQLHIAEGIPDNDALLQQLIKVINREAIDLRYYSTGQPTVSFAIDLTSLAEYGVTISPDAIAFAYEYIDAFNQAYDKLATDVAALPPYEKQERPESSVMVGNSGENYMKITLRTTAGDGDHFVKFVRTDAEDNASSLSVYIRDGETINAYLPAGEYKILHAIGTDWYGSDYFFGQDGHYYLDNGTLKVANGYTYAAPLPGIEESEAGSSILDMFTF